MRLTLRSSDGIPFQVEDAVLLQIDLLRRLFCPDFGVSAHDLPTVELLFPVMGRATLMPPPEFPVLPILGDTLARVISYCEFHAQTAYMDNRIWDADFVGNLDMHFLIALTKAAEYFEIQTLFDVCADTIAHRIQHMEPPEVFATFNEGEQYAQEDLEFFGDHLNLDDVSLRLKYTKGFKVPGNERVNIEQPRDFVLSPVVSEANYRSLLNAMIFGNIFYGAINKIRHPRAWPPLE